MSSFAATTGPSAAAALEAIYAGPGNAYAVLDAARSRRVLRLVRERRESARILYEGPIAPDIAEVARTWFPRRAAPGWRKRSSASDGATPGGSSA